MLLFSVDFESNPYLIIAFALVVIAGLFLIVLFVLALVNSHKNKKTKKQIYNTDSNVRIFTFNLNNNTIRFFDKNNLKKQRVTTFDAFLNEYHPDDKEKVREWITNFVEDAPNKSLFLTMNVKMTNSKKKYLSIYKITSFDKTSNLLHLENTILPNYVSKQHKNSISHYVRDVQDIKDLIKSKKKYQTNISIICIRLTLKVEHSKKNLRNTHDTSQTMTLTSIYEPLDSICRTLSKDRMMAFLNDSEALLFDFSLEEKSDVSNFCNNIFAEVDRFIALKSLSKLYDVSIGCASKLYLSDTTQSIDSLIGEARNMCYIAQHKNGEKVAIYGVDSTNVSSFDMKTSNEIKALIKNQTFRVFFTPILSYKGECNDYSLVKLVPYGITIKNMEEVFYQARSISYLRDLSLAVFKKLQDLLTRYPKTTFIVPFSLRYINEVSTSLFIFKDVKDRIKFLFDKTEIEDLYDGNYEIESDLDTLENYGIKYCLKVDSPSINIPKDIVKKFSLFVLSLDSEKLSLDDSHRKSSFISLQSMLMSYSKPIIVDDLKNRNDIELLHNLNYDNYICHEFAAPSSLPYVADDKWKSVIN